MAMRVCNNTTQTTPHIQLNTPLHQDATKPTTNMLDRIEGDIWVRAPEIEPEVSLGRSIVAGHLRWRSSLLLHNGSSAATATATTATAHGETVRNAWYECSTHRLLAGHIGTVVVVIDKCVIVDDG